MTLANGKPMQAKLPRRPYHSPLCSLDVDNNYTLGQKEYDAIISGTLNATYITYNDVTHHLSTLVT